jgi:hypothetical protein
MAISFSGGRSWGTQRESLTMGKQLVIKVASNGKNLEGTLFTAPH